VLSTDIGRILRDLRVSVGLSQSQLATLSQRSQQQISHIERGRSDTSLTTLEALSAAMGFVPLLLMVAVPVEGRDLDLASEDVALLQKLALVLPALPPHRRLMLEELVSAWGPDARGLLDTVHQ